MWIIQKRYLAHTVNKLGRDRGEYRYDERLALAPSKNSTQKELSCLGLERGICFHCLKMSEPEDPGS